VLCWSIWHFTLTLLRALFGLALCLFERTTQVVDEFFLFFELEVRRATSRSSSRARFSNVLFSWRKASSAR
jgi:hypothetical protein